MTVKAELLEILACPKCKQVVELAESDDAILCAACRLSFPIRDDIPVMLLEEAESLD